MRQKIMSILLIALLMMPIGISANEAKVDKSKNKKTVCYPLRTQRPNAPGITYVSCEVSDGLMSFYWNMEARYITVELISNGTSVWSDYVTEDSQSVECPEITGTFTLKCTTEGNGIYIGTIVL